MARTPSNMVALGSEAPVFRLPEVRSKEIVCFSPDPAYQANLILFTCNHCPFVKHILPGLKQFSNDYQNKALRIIAISANDAAQYPEDSPAAMALLAETEAFSFPYLYDESQEVAKAFQAACTPDFFLYDAELKLAYRGQADSSRPGSQIAVDFADLRLAVDALLAGKSVDFEQRPSLGCNIKWKD